MAGPVMPIGLRSPPVKVPPLWAWVLFSWLTLHLWLFRKLRWNPPFGVKGLFGELLGAWGLCLVTTILMVCAIALIEPLSRLWGS
jgi:hypothetical protein